MGFLGCSAGEESTCNSGDPGSISGSGRSPGEGRGYPLQYSWASWWLRWSRICLQCGRPGFHPWVRKIPWRRAWQPTPVFLPGESPGQRSLAGYSPRGCKESDRTEWLNIAQHTWSVGYKLGREVVCIHQTRIQGQNQQSINFYGNISMCPHCTIYIHIYDVYIFIYCIGRGYI